MASSQVEQNLAADGHQVRQSFQNAYRSLEQNVSNVAGQLEPPAVESEMQRFLLWATNLGLFHHDHSSLDYRLRDNETVRSFTKTLLSNIIESLDEIASAATVDGSPDVALDAYPSGNTKLGDFGDDDSLKVSASPVSDTGPVITGVLNDEDEPMMKLYFENVTESIDQLFKLASQIRSPATRQARTGVDLYRDVDADIKSTYIRLRKLADERGIEQLLIQSRKDLNPSGDENTDFGLESEDNVLVQRLQKANHLRRQQFEYWKRYKKRSVRETSKAVGFVPFRPNAGLPMTPDHGKSPLQGLLPTAPLSERTGSLMSSAPALPQSFTLAENKSTYSGTSRGLTVHGPSGEKIEWPKPPHEKHYGKAFECPYCFFICSPKYLEDLAWRAHLKHDLKPYICTYDNCMEPNILYDSWEDWAGHEQWAHRQRIWRCPDHPGEEHVERSSYEDHLRRQHTTTQHQLLSSELLSASESISRSCDRPCPFCKRDFEQPSEMQQHVAGHLESVALLSLPRPDEDDAGSQGDKMASNSANRNYAESRTGDFDEVEPLVFPENDGETQETARSTEVERQSFKEKLAAKDTLFYKPDESLSEAKATYSKDIVLEWLGYPRETDRSLFPLFRAVDGSQKGHLTKQELGKALEISNLAPFDEGTVSMMMNMFDIDRVGTINYVEFCGLWSFLAAWRSLFDRFDEDESGSISFEEYIEAVVAFGYRLSDDFVYMLYRSFEHRDEGEMSFDIFVQSCITLKRMTDVFKRYDEDRDGYVTFAYEDFLTEMFASAITK